MGGLTVPDIRAHKIRDGAIPLVMVTAYDAPSASVVDEAGADIILVGDSLAMVVLGHDDTLHVTVDDMAYHTAAVTRVKPDAHVVADMPWMSYHVSPTETVCNAAALVRAGAGSVKLEGGLKRLPMIEKIVTAEIPVMGHIGLTPQSLHAMGGFKVQARHEGAANELVNTAQALAAAGCYAVVLEGVPAPVSAAVTEAVGIPTIGIGAGSNCDGQVLVYHDLLGMARRIPPKFVRCYADLHAPAVEAVERFAADVRSRAFPVSAESYQAPAAARSD